MRAVISFDIHQKSQGNTAECHITLDLTEGALDPLSFSLAHVQPQPPHKKNPGWHVDPCPPVLTHETAPVSIQHRSYPEVRSNCVCREPAALGDLAARGLDGTRHGHCVGGES